MAEANASLSTSPGCSAKGGGRLKASTEAVPCTLELQLHARNMFPATLRSLETVPVPQSGCNSDSNHHHCQRERHCKFTAIIPGFLGAADVSCRPDFSLPPSRPPSRRGRHTCVNTLAALLYSSRVKKMGLTPHLSRRPRANKPCASNPVNDTWPLGCGQKLVEQKAVMGAARCEQTSPAPKIPSTTRGRSAVGKQKWAKDGGKGGQRTGEKGGKGRGKRGGKLTCERAGPL
eukprot:181217-Chlamydomonas_euryale.AAC.3